MDGSSLVGNIPNWLVYLGSALLALWAGQKVLEAVVKGLRETVAAHNLSHTTALADLKEQLQPVAELSQRLSTVLTGLNGDNGMVGETRSNTKRITHLEREVAVIGDRTERIERMVEGGAT